MVDSSSPLQKREEKKKKREDLILPFLVPDRNAVNNMITEANGCLLHVLLLFNFTIVNPPGIGFLLDPV